MPTDAVLPCLLIVASLDQYHREMTRAAAPFFRQLGDENGFTVDFAEDGSPLTDENLRRYAAIVQLNLAPFDMTTDQQTALEAFVERGGGWIGIHAAGLTGRQFGSGKPYWQWFEDLMGGVSYSPHPAYQEGVAVVEDRTHPATRNLPERFSLGCEWYEFDKSPRGQVRVLATADEASYRPNRPMGDHPVVWVNERYRRAIYIAFGHDSRALGSNPFAILLRDSVVWALSTP